MTDPKVIPPIKSQAIDILGAISGSKKVEYDLQQDYAALKPRIENESVENVTQLLKDEKSGWINCPEL